MPSFRQSKLFYKSAVDPSLSDPAPSFPSSSSAKGEVARNATTINLDHKSNAGMSIYVAGDSGAGAISTSKNKICITETIGAIFEAPENALIIHSCNCLGSWSAGIAAAFRTRYPQAFNVYKNHCETRSISSLIGTSLLIPPTESDGPRHFIGCLFTSRKFGKSKDNPEAILIHTATAMKDLLQRLSKQDDINEIRMCRINSGLFAVPWQETRTVIDQLDVPGGWKIPRTIVIYEMKSRRGGDIVDIQAPSAHLE